MKYLAVPALIIILALFTFALGGSFVVAMPFLSVISISIMLILCFLVVHFIKRDEKRLLIYWLLISTIPGLMVIIALKFYGADSFLSWDLMLWDLIIPMAVSASQWLFIMIKNRL
ncbi:MULTISPECIES: hypothetical protein [Neobacillus]|uniref:Uncharacterized protein n=1 Tax=Neobacillus rhizophilus TaxID=2833579 RepID=A0A942U2P4_9BACI|nr:MULTISPECIES: hypothetical protein [Neobacillus]MBS4213505.1 hypothetical protein [Neobacillus rhizophilus]MBU8918085.1 hypothetical protein [Bacillus sp. FJAT-29953]